MKRLIIAVAGLVTFVDCSDVEGPDLENLESMPRFSEHEEGPQLRPVAGRRSEGTTVDIAAKNWFSIDIDVAGSLKPSDLISLTRNLHGDLRYDRRRSTGHRSRGRIRKVD